MKRTNPIAGVAYALTQAERDVMGVLAEGHTAISVVRLSADLYERGEDERFTFGDPIGYVTWLLEGLNVEGFVTYRVNAYNRRSNNDDDSDPPGLAGLPYHVRLTPKGWVALGYTHLIVEVGRSGRLREVRSADTTDYRNHDYIAKGGPISRHWWWQCATASSIFMQEREPMTEQALPERRTYIRVTPELEERVVASYIRTGSYAKTAQETNVTDRQVRYIIHDRPNLGRDNSSLKVRVLDLIRANGPYPDMMTLHKDIPGPHGLHNLVHVVHSLHKAALIDFRTERSKTGGGTNYLAIKAREVVPGNGKSVTPIELAPTELAPTDELPDQSTIHPAPSTEYPELERLIAAEGETNEARTKASQYIAAAENLSDIDPGMADVLLAKAAAIDAWSLNPVESEYLTYAKAHPREGQAEKDEAADWLDDQRHLAGLPSLDYPGQE